MSRKLSTDKLAPGVGFEGFSRPIRPQRTGGVWVLSEPRTKQKLRHKVRIFVLAPGVGFEPTTNRLTAERSAAELPRNKIFTKITLVLYFINNPLIFQYP